MRILAVNPDTLGDVVLRQPMFRALMDAGHELTLLLRPLVTPIARLIAPNARLIEFSIDIYNPMLRPEDASLEPLVEQAREAKPDVLLVAAFQWTALEERLAEALTAENPRLRVVALTGHPFESATWGGAYESNLRARATVEADEALPELRKNERLASAVLGRAVTLPAPKIEPDSACLRAAEARLVTLGFKTDAYWVACVGETETTRIRNWPLERWSALLAKWHREHGRRFLLIGEKGEAESLRIAEQGVKREAGAGACAVWTGEDRGALDTLVGLIAKSRGYVGRDTGPMHLAAAIDKPVLAIFGGGTWPRFVPAPERGGGVALTMGVPCIGCGWHCHLDRSVCIKDVPLEAAWDAARAIEDAKRGDEPGLEARVLEPGPERLSDIARQSTSVARERLVKLGQSILETKQLRRETRMEVRDAARPGTPMELAIRGELARFETTTMERAVRAENALNSARAELDATKRQLAVSSVRQNELQAQVMQLASERAQHATAAAGARDRAIELETRMVALEQRVIAKERELQAAKATPAQPAAPTNVQPAPDPALIAKASQAQALAAKLQGEKARAEAELADARLTVQRLRGDLQTLATQTEQSARALDQANERVHNLMASRWRKLGQRLGVAMVMPWERDASANGRH